MEIDKLKEENAALCSKTESLEEKLLNLTRDVTICCLVVPRCHRLAPHIKGKLHDIVINLFSWHGNVVEVLKYENLLPKCVFVSEDFPDVQVEKCSILKSIVTLGIKMDKYKDKSVLLETNYSRWKDI